MVLEVGLGDMPARGLALIAYTIGNESDILCLLQKTTHSI